MPRKSTKSTPGSAPRSSFKRAAPDKATPTRQSKRTKATPAKSPYFDPDSDQENENPNSPSSEEEVGSGNGSDYEEDESKDPSSESDHGEEPSSEDDAKPKKKTPGGRSAKQAPIPMHKKQAEEKELWKPGAKLPPGTQLIIKKPKAREAGDIPYSDNTIHPNTMLFLKDLAANNDRQWLKMHDPDYRASHQDFTTFLGRLSQKVIEADETIPELPVKDIIFRIYRDMRFTNNPVPYKTHYSAAWSRTGRKGPYAAYYVQIQPDGGSFVGGGLWQPEASALSKLRRDIDRKPHKIKRVLADARIRKAFLGGVPNDEKKAVRAFTNQSGNRETALKKHPKGYDNDHKDIELLRLRNFTIGTKLSDEEVVGAKGLDRIAELIGCMVPFITYLNSVVMPDEESSDSSAEEDEEDEDGEEDSESN
ncbi:hypothetical protein K469DRAFT_559809 [Zopfia rhizophila CBS 207.26]|uniref:Uncharacterized protein n=1 Tax=Zopfia rhizophila CBS 207.26 TaxID=1314779 RepID=A0A6A6EK24_9PEZI|nr:hypothetical protein K469DRAFT_559809 [Zopfia rhizophila CBS 207.26]